MFGKIITADALLALIEQQKDITTAKNVVLQLSKDFDGVRYSQTFNLHMTTEYHDPNLVDIFAARIDTLINTNKFSRIFELKATKKDSMAKARSSGAYLAKELKYPSAMIRIERGQTAQEFFWIGIPGIVELMDFPNTFAAMTASEVDTELRDRAIQKMKTLGTV